MEPLPFPELRELARSNGSVNVDLADYYSLRWHDPFWLTAWARWNAAQHGWARVWPYVSFKFYGSVYDPDPSKIPEPAQAAVALEYVEARKAYLAATNHFLLR